MKILLVLALAGLCTTAVADPNGVARQLMNQQVSMMDFGLERIELAMPKEVTFDAVKGASISLNFTAKFDWASSQIILNADLYTQTVGPKAHPHDATTIRSLCKEGIGWIRYLMGIDLTTGKPMSSAATVASYFRPKSFAYTQELPDFAPTIYAMTRIAVTETAINGELKPVASTRCEAPYLGTDALFPG